MDPFTQGVVGAKLAQAFPKNGKELFFAGAIGWLSGMAADLDVLIRSESDSLLFFEYHRHFTHSLIFIPIGALLCAFLGYFLLFKNRLSFPSVYYYSLLGYGTHALLDCCTSYGTQLLWPFSDHRVAWDIISIVDPLYTLPLFTLVVASVWRRNPLFARIAIVYGLIYMGVGLVQRERAREVGKVMADERGHHILRLEAKPGFANLIVWKIIYETEDKYYVDAVRLGWTPKYLPGESIEKLNIERDLPWLDKSTTQARDIERFKRFAIGFVAKDPNNPNRVVDVRYSALPNQLKSLWGIELFPKDQNRHAKFEFTRDTSPEMRLHYWRMILGDDF